MAGISGIIRASRPSFRNAHDRLAYAVYARSMLTDPPLRLLGVGAAAEAVPAAAGEGHREEVGTEGWNDGDDGYAFRYSFVERGEKNGVQGKVEKLVLVKGLILQHMLIVSAVVDGRTDPVIIELDTREYSTNNPGLVEGFRNIEKLDEGLTKFYDAIISPSVIEEQCPLKEDQPHSIPRQGHPSYITDRPERDYDPLRIPQMHRPGGIGGNVPHPLSVGGEDLNPLGLPGVHDPFGAMGGGGNLMGPGHPAFSSLQRPRPGGGLPPGVPPGARYDPFGPPGLPGFGRPPPDDFHPDLPRPPGGPPPPDMYM